VRDVAIGDYGGSLDKEDSSTEGDAPYAWFVYRELTAQRGSAYSGRVGGTLVHCEHLAMARLLGWVCFRLPEKFVANTLPSTADDGLDYWVKVLAIPTRASDQKWQKRQRCAVHYRLPIKGNLDEIKVGLSELLGDIFVDASFSTGGELSTPPALTYWPGVNPGPAEYDLGGGTWMSERSHLWVEVQGIASMPASEMNQLLNVQMFQYLDRALPAFCTFAYSVGGGFILDVSQLDFTGLTPE